MLYLSREDIDAFADRILSRYLKSEFPNGHLYYNVDPIRLAQIYGFKVEYVNITRDGSILGQTSSGPIWTPIVDEDIARMYELWYQAKCAVYNTYTDNDPIKKPLSQEEAFKPIRNALVREADALGRQLVEVEFSSKEEDTPEERDEGDSTDTPPAGDSAHPLRPAPAPESPPSPTPSMKPPASYGNRNGRIATSIARFGNSLSRTFRDNYYEQAMRVPSFVDSRLQREIEAKKRGQNLSM